MKIPQIPAMTGMTPLGISEKAPTVAQTPPADRQSYVEVPSERADVTLTNGRVIVHCLQPNGSQLAYMADGGAMSDDEWNEYCGKISTRAIRFPRLAEPVPPVKFVMQ